MLTHKVTYMDLNGNEVVEELLFNLTRAELVDLDAEIEGGFEGFEAKRLSEALVQIKALIIAAYGEKSEDGRRFVKTPELTENFRQSMAFAKVFDELAEGDEAFFKAFIGGIMPDGFLKELEIQAAEHMSQQPTAAVPTLPTPSQITTGV